MAPEYTIDRDAITIRDFMKLQKNANDFEAQIEIIKKAVKVNGKGTLEDLPVRHWRAIVKAIMDDIGGESLGN